MLIWVTCPSTPHTQKRGASRDKYRFQHKNEDLAKRDGFSHLLNFAAAAFAKQVKLFFLSMGNAGDMGSSKSLHQSMDAAGIKNVYYESPGTAHEWQTWRRSLREFAPLLFQTAKDGNQ